MFDAHDELNKALSAVGLYVDEVGMTCLQKQDL